MHRLRDRCVLIVEDESLVGMEIEFAVTDLGAKSLGPAVSIDEAMRLIAQEGNGIDAAVLDVDLNGEEVFPVANRLKELGIPFLFHTGNANLDDLRTDYEGAPICVKPTPPEKLLEQIRDLLFEE
ncbi:response regulator [Erythrobacter sp. THAF29]|uniref:response regulator n=1 Tax=Erythrobacter sp. THAF29 TaxID=2587851 RepID=UPI0012678D64|nr:response regulator [Erythrobacter sp. THAF29]QFT76820.1 two-component response regulator [Erythrobacter sp. THAF29]